MLTMQFTFVTLLVSLFTVESSVPPGLPPWLTDALSRLVDSNSNKSMKCLSGSREREPGQSVATAIPSLLSTVAQEALFSDGTLRTALLGFLDLKNDNEIKKSFLRAFDSLRDQKGVTSELGLAVYAASPLSQDYIRTYYEVFGGVAKSIDLRNATEAARQINEWVGGPMCHNEDLISPRDLSVPNPGLFFISKYKFTCDWSPEVRPRLGEMEFCNSKGESSWVPALHFNGPIKHARLDSICAQMVKIPAGGKWYFVIVFPDQVDDVDNVLRGLEDVDIFKAGLKSVETKYISISFPVPKTWSNIDYRNCVQKSSYVLDLFVPRPPQSVRCKTKNHHISAILQKNRLDVTSCLKNRSPGDCSGSNDAPSDMDIQVNREFIYGLMCDFETWVMAGVHSN